MTNNNTILILGAAALGFAAYYFGQNSSKVPTQPQNQLPLQTGTTNLIGYGIVPVGILNGIQYYKVNNVWIPAQAILNAFTQAQQSGGTGGQNVGQWLLNNADDLIRLGEQLFGHLFGNGNNGGG